MDTQMFRQEMIWLKMHHILALNTNGTDLKLCVPFSTEMKVLSHVIFWSAMVNWLIGQQLSMLGLSINTGLLVKVQGRLRTYLNWQHKTYISRCLCLALKLIVPHWFVLIKWQTVHLSWNHLRREILTCWMTNYLHLSVH